MGQYYYVYLEKEDGKVIVFNRKVDEEYVMAKIMEHSYIPNPTMMAVCSFIENSPTRIVWCGDYGDDASEGDDIEVYNIVYAEDEDGVALPKVDFNYENKFLINLDKKQAVSFNDYIKDNTVDGWCIHPLSLLTAQGNGRGGGDYRGINKDVVGTWRKDLLVISNQLPKEVEIVEMYFKEEKEN